MSCVTGGGCGAAAAETANDVGEQAGLQSRTS